MPLVLQMDNIIKIQEVNIMAKVRGWYYDKQMNSPLTSATLHANMWWDSGKKEFINWNEIENDNGFGNHSNECDRDKYETIIGAVKGACGYGIDPICTSIINEDFNIAISNTWSEFGGDPIGNAWNDLRGPLSGVAKPIIDSLNTLFENNKTAKQNSGENISKMREWLQAGADYVHGKLDTSKFNEFDVVSFLNKALVTNGTRFTYYGGTGIAFGNLGMKFTVFPKWENNQFLDVQNQVTKLYPYFIGQMETFEEATGVGKGNSNDSLAVGTLKDAANRCFMFQNPPGGYLTEMSGIDLIQRGTLKLKIGGFYEITNLVCSDVMLNFSKNMVKNPINQEISPLFCDVNITLRPSTKYSDRMLRAFVGGSDTARKSMRRIIEKNLEEERNKLKSSIVEEKYIIDQD
jgi:hypothetical protein